MTRRQAISGEITGSEQVSLGQGHLGIDLRGDRDLAVRRICMAMHGCTSKAASSEPQVFRVLCTVILGTWALVMR